MPEDEADKVTGFLEKAREPSVSPQWEPHRVISLWAHHFGERIRGLRRVGSSLERGCGALSDSGLDGKHAEAAAGRAPISMRFKGLRRGGRRTGGGLSEAELTDKQRCLSGLSVYACREWTKLGCMGHGRGGSGDAARGNASGRQPLDVRTGRQGALRRSCGKR